MFTLLFIRYEMFGQDPMKRSINDQLYTQVQAGLFLTNLIFPIWIWRVFIGPISSGLAQATVFLSHVISTFQVIVLTEASVSKAAMILKWSYMARLDEQFFGFFLLLLNLLLAVLPHFTRLLMVILYLLH